jgi:hypothetical protein
MYTIAGIIAAVLVVYAGYKIYQNWPKANSVSDLAAIFKNYNSVDDIKTAYDKAIQNANDFKAKIEAEVKAIEDKAAALKALIS